MASALLAMSQEEAKEALPTGSNCNAQSAGSAITVAGEAATASASAGFSVWVNMWKPGK